MSIWTSESFKEFPSRELKSAELMPDVECSYHVATTFYHDFILLELDHGVDRVEVLLSVVEARDLADSLSHAAFGLLVERNVQVNLLE